MEITINNICLNCKASNKNDAVEEVGLLLVRNGNINSDYISSMHKRENVSNTFLGNGIAIPHGMQNDKDNIIKTGIAILQFKNGLEWNPGEIVHLVVGIAAKSDEHIEILGNLTALVKDVDLVKRLAATDKPEEIIQTLSNSKKDKKVSDKLVLKKGERFVEAVIIEKTGLHARPASVFIELTRKYNAVIKLQKVGHEEIVNADSMASLLSLRIKNGDSIRIIASGNDSETALKELKDAVDKGLVQDDDEELPVTSENTWKPEKAELEFKGVAASGGIAAAPLKIIKRIDYNISKVSSESDFYKEIVKLEKALTEATSELETIYSELCKKTGVGKASVFKAHAEFLRDPEIINNAKKLIEKGASAEWSWKESFEKKSEETKNLNDSLLSERAIDIKDVGLRVLKILLQSKTEDLSDIKDKTIIIADELTPSETVRLNPEFILGICTAKGGALSHTAIIARSLGIPAIVGAGDNILGLWENQTAVINGFSGCLYINPSEKDLIKAKELGKKIEELSKIEFEERFQPAITKDGHRVEIAANIGNVSEAEKVLENGGEGVGLFRTEFLFLQRKTAPSEEEQINIYSKVLESLKGLPLTLRTLDAGGDKQISYLNLHNEENPFLGVRGIRLCLKHPELLKTQLRSAFKSAEKGHLRLMFPMVSKISEMIRIKKLIDELKPDYKIKKLEIGIMVEVPSAVLMAEAFAKHVDFFSIGTNDLTQYTLAMDRGNSELASEAKGLDPAVLKMIKMTVEAAHKNDKWVGVCGDMAGITKSALILTGLGVDELSMNIFSIPKIKREIRKVKYSEIKELSEKALKCETAEEVERILK